METVISESKPLVYVEVVDAHHRVLQRFSLNSPAFTIGRGFDNDIILDDEFISTKHLSVTFENNKFIINDLKSTNGFFIKKKHYLDETFQVEAKQVIKLGQTRLRFRYPQEALDKTAQDRILLGDKFWSSRHPGFVFSALLAMLGLFALDVYLETPIKLTGARLSGEVLTGVLIVVVWAGLWSLFSKIMTDRLSFIQHAGIFIVANITAMFFAILLSYLFYTFAWDGLFSKAITLLIGVIFCWMVYRHLAVSTHLSQQSRLVIAGVLATTGVAIYLLDEQLLSDEFDPSPKYALLVKSPDYNLSQGTSLDQFFTKSKLQAEKSVERDQ